MAVPTKDVSLLNYGANFKTRITASPSTFDLSPTQVSGFTAVYDPFVVGYNNLVDAREAGIESKNLLAIKEACKTALLSFARQLYTMIQANDAVLDSDKVLLGITIRKTPTPKPVPESSPDIDIVSVIGRQVKARIHNAEGESKNAKPANVAAAAVYTYVGENAPSDPSQYTFQGVTTTTLTEIQFADSVPSGATVWMCAAWMNPRGQFGMACSPVSFTLQGGAARAQAA